MSMEIVVSVLMVLMMVYILTGTVRMLRQTRSLLPVVLFGFGIACELLSSLYWIAYDLMRPDTRMPIAANEIAEWAAFLLLASSLRHDIPSDRKKAVKEMAAAAVFTAANAALWIGWSGEWVEDILTGAALGYFICVLVSCLKHTKVFSKKEWVIIAILSFVLAASQAVTFFVSEPIRKSLDMFCYVLIFAGIAFFFIKTALSFRSGSAKEMICLSNASLAWCAISMYMSSGWFYIAAFIGSAVSFMSIFLAHKREVKTA